MGFGEWRVKSYLVIAKCFMERKEFSDAISTLKTTKNIISMYSTGEEAKKAENDTSIQTSLMRLKFQEKERKKILARCIEQKKVLLKKEKARAQVCSGERQEQMVMMLRQILLKDSVKRVKSMV